MSRWEKEYDDAFYDPYDDYSDEEDWKQQPAPKKRHEPPKQQVPVKQATQTTREAKNSTKPAASEAVAPALEEQEVPAEGEELGEDKTPSLPERRVSRRLNLDEYRMDPALEELCRETEANETLTLATLHLIIMGHVDAGKSTLMGRLLHDLGFVDQKTAHKNAKQAAEAGKNSFAWAWVLDERPEERARGVTVDVATSRFQTEKFNVVLLDAPGHRDFVPNMISGAAQADAAILAVDGSINGFEAGFQQGGQGFRSPGGGQMREHALLARSLGIEQLAVVVTKLDTCNYSQERFEEIKRQLLPFLQQCGYKNGSLQWLVCSAPKGVNVTESPVDEPLLSWFNGSPVLQAINNFQPVARNIEVPMRLPITEGLKSWSLGGSAISGKIESGAVGVGSRVCVMPSGELAIVKAIEVDGQGRRVAKAGESCELGLSEVDPSSLHPGSVLCTEGWPCAVASRFDCRVVVLEPPAPMIPGLQVSLQSHAIRESGDISRLISLLDPKTGAVTKAKPRCLIKGQTALVEITASRPICVEEYTLNHALGRMTLRESGRTIAVGIIVTIHESCN